MNWIKLLTQVFFGVFVTSATGSVMFFIWFLCRLFLQNWNPKLVYYMLRWVVVMHVLPITYVAIVLNYNAGYVQQGESISKMLVVLNLNQPFWQALAIVWFVVSLGVALYFWYGKIANRLICKNNFDDGNSLAQVEFERIKEELGITAKVELFRNDHPKLKSPFTRGIRNCEVVIPYLEYSKEELHVILYHELSHIKRSDMFFRYLTMFVMAINSINPVTYFLWENVVLWSEASCDAMALDELEKEGVDKKRYYGIIWNFIDGDSASRELFYFPMLRGATKSLYRRMEIMEKYRARTKMVAKSITFAWVLVFAMVSSVTAHAAGLGVAEANDNVLRETQSVAQDGSFTEESGWAEEIFVPANDVVDIVYINDGIMELGGGTFEWEVPTGTRYVTSSKYFTAGTEVQVACTATPSSNTYWFGIMNANSDCYVVEGSGSGSHTFTVPSTGYYYIMVENRSSSTITVRGSYSY